MDAFWVLGFSLFALANKATLSGIQCLKKTLAQPVLTWLTFICKQHPVICVDTDREVLYFVWHILPAVAVIQHLSIILIGWRKLLVHEEERSSTWRVIHANLLFLRPDRLRLNNKWKNVGKRQVCIVSNYSSTNILWTVYSPFLSARRKIWKKREGRRRLLPQTKHH